MYLELAQEVLLFNLQLAFLKLFFCLSPPSEFCFVTEITIFIEKRGVPIAVLELYLQIQLGVGRV